MTPIGVLVQWRHEWRGVPSHGMVHHHFLLDGTEEYAHRYLSAKYAFAGRAVRVYDVTVTPLFAGASLGQGALL